MRVYIGDVSLLYGIGNMLYGVGKSGGDVTSPSLPTVRRVYPCR